MHYHLIEVPWCSIELMMVRAKKWPKPCIIWFIIGIIKLNRGIIIKDLSFQANDLQVIFRLVSAKSFTFFSFTLLIL